MTLYDKIIAVYPDLTDADFNPKNGLINLRNDADEIGDYISKWEYSQPIPDGLKLGK